MIAIDGNRFRRGRFAWFLEMIADAARHRGTVRILDIGGTVQHWRAMEDLWKDYTVDITVVNLDAEITDEGPLHQRPGNACDMSQYPDLSFDIVYSNSVIEHVGHWSEMSLMGAEIERLAPAYFVQTPNFGFPVEPHYRSLFFHWYPEIIRAEMLLKRRHGFRGPYRDLNSAMRDVQSVNLLNGQQMQVLFPSGTLRREMILGFTKSLVMIRRGPEAI